METKPFQSESKRLLELMIHSIYTHKEIFLRELISNASDAIDKLYFRSLTDGGVGKSREDFAITLVPDKEARTLTITDNGIGMTKEELENNLGVIAKSGSLAFKSELEKDADVDIIGQFGVGFYSAFMVSDLVTVKTRAYGSDTAYVWQSSGAEGYTIDETDKPDVGTEIVLRIKDNTDDANYDEFIEPYRIKALVKKYSDFIRFPIKMDMEHSHLKEGTENEYETHTVTETLNSMVPIWRKNKSELTDEEYNKFYQEKFYDYEPPLLHLHIKTEGTATYNALLYIPGRAPFDYYTKEYEKGLQLFSSGVMIMEKCGDLLPDHFSFVKGLVDSEDLSLNISREMLQHDRQLKLIEKSLEKSVRNELKKLLENDREKYESFFKTFGLQLKYGLYAEYGAHKELLQDLLLFTSSLEKKPVTLAEYVSRMKEEQKEIYYAAAESIARADMLPQTELVRERGYEILYFTDNVDEFAIRMLSEYEGKPFKSVSDGDLDLGDDENKEELEKLAKDNEALLTSLKEALADKVGEVRLSKRLKTHPVCLASGGKGLSLEMEKVLNAMPNEQKVKAERILELNGEHPLFATLRKLQEAGDKERVADYAKVLYGQALLIEGLPMEDPVEFSDLLSKLISE